MSHAEIIMYLSEKLNPEDYEIEPVNPYLIDIRPCMSEDMVTMLDSIGLQQDRPITAEDTMTFLTLKLKDRLRQQDAAAPLTGNPHGPRKAPFACGDGNIWRQEPPEPAAVVATESSQESQELLGGTIGLAVDGRINTQHAVCENVGFVPTCLSAGDGETRVETLLFELKPRGGGFCHSQH